MKFLIDESADVRLEAYLRAHGHEVKTVARGYSQALEDTAILRIAAAERRIHERNDAHLALLDPP